MKNYKYAIFIAVLLYFSNNMQAAKVYIEAHGIVMMQAENTESSLDLWKKGNLIGSSGTGHIEFTGNTPLGTGPDRSPLIYKFKITNASDYALLMNGRRSDKFTDGRKDIGNDCYVRVEGDFAPGTGGTTDLNFLKQDEKMFIGRGGYVDATRTFDWRWGEKLDIEGLSSQPKPIYNFKAGETYTLIVSGRSAFFCLDRILFVKSTVNQETAKALTTESDSFDDGSAIERYTYDALSQFVTPAVYQGRVAVVADGNFRDSDDIIGTPISLAILRAMELEKKLVHYSHSCDLKPGSKDQGGDYREAEMKLSCDGTASRWGGFEHLTFFNCMKQKAAVIADLAAQINTSTETDPLWIIEAGEPDIMWEAVNRCEPAKRNYVHIVTHHPANDKGDEYDLGDVMELGIPGTNLHSIPDQNTLLKTSLSDWHWARDHSDDCIKWLWERGYASQTEAMNYPAIVGKFDCSDAGMIYYWATIEDGGDFAPDVPKLKKLFLTYTSAIK